MVSIIRSLLKKLEKEPKLAALLAENLALGVRALEIIRGLR